ESAGHDLLLSFPDAPIWLEGDPTRLAQVVANLLNNAAKYTDKGGRIVLTASRDGDQVVVSVRDNGIGLSREMLPRVFDLFAQEDRSLDRAQGGLGIGLTLVRSLVGLHGGSVGVRSEGLGKGSEFSVRLPLSARATAAEPATRTAADPPVSTRLRILVVD